MILPSGNITDNQKNWTYARKGLGRTRVVQEITDLVLHMARENVSWGHDRIQGALANQRLGGMLNYHCRDAA